ncbi:TonB-dependent receptor [Alteromonas sp. ASW11-19]|uniref:TonB-dependent receptor n=1 Tax=Alteromonas salexigens TaxID=2982530 RepID=A0ABT2VQG7_9ALTE|nr:TonB-dependent receptor [Alteromonas salexigens]MCU7555360.1 TonB-dependent receptor [Alteromonas salexigens]
MTKTSMFTSRGRLTAVAAIISASLSTPALADETSVERVSIIGNQQKIDQAAGAVDVIGELQLEQFQFDDINRILSQVPGVNIRQEDGYGLRPNIGFRGVTPERSKKINIMEDGVLIGPAPYSAPAAYYFPMASRMTAVEVTKGPSTIQYGPNTVAGAINMVSRGIPADSEGAVDVAAGTDGYYKGHAHYGNTNGQFGYLLEAITLGADGFKELDNGDDTGFDKTDLLAKFNYRFSVGETSQLVELKVSRSDETSNETYLGLTDADFAATPYRRYAASQLDKFEAEHSQVQLTHLLETDQLRVTTRLYRNDFERDWFKIDNFTSSQGGQVPSLLEILTRPEDETNQRYYQVLTGQRDSTSQEILQLNSNDREFFSQGVQIDVDGDVTLFGLQHEIATGIRFHEDEIQRNHTATNYFMRSGSLTPTGEDTRATTTNTENTEAISVYLQDTITLGDLRLTAGIRGELIDGYYQNRTPGFEQDFQHKTTRIWLPSVSGYYALNREHGVFAGVHKGFVPTSPIQDASIDVEESINYEAGWRYINNGTRVEVTTFYSDYSNLIESCSLSSGCATDLTFAAGEVDVYGLETSWHTSYRLTNGWSMPITVNYTRTESEFNNSFYSSFAQWGFVNEGDSVPYLANNVGSLSIGLQGNRWDVYLLANYVSDMPEAAQTALTGDSRDSTLAGVRTDAMFTLDMSASYRFPDWGKVYLKLDNVTEEEDIVSRRPYGARPGKPRQVQLGYQYQF